MNTYNLLSGSTFVAVAVLFISFKTPEKELKKFQKVIQGNYAFISGGKVKTGKQEKQLKSYFMAKNEVSNFDYAEFLADLKNSGDKAKYELARIDSSNWSKNGDLAPYATYYHKHPAYNHYPVVNVTKRGAELYCEWLTEKWNTTKGLEHYTVQFSLPTKAEWIHAARGGNENAFYAWEGERLYNDKRMPMCNFKQLSAENIHFNSQSGEYEVKKVHYKKTLVEDAELTAPVHSYWPNEYGIYNMCGNVAEMIQEENIAMGGSWSSTGYDVRVDSEIAFTGVDTRVGFRPVMTIISK